MSEVLGIVAKWPTPGGVKTRLGLAPDEAARVALAFLMDTVARLGRADRRTVVVFSPAESRAEFATLLGTGVDLVAQADGDLGARLERFLADQLNAGATKVVVVGTDSPTLPIDLVAQAFAALDDADVVLGPATDGGYYLLGCRRLPPCFAGIAWGGARVLAETVVRLSDPSWKLALLPPWYDVDTPESWAMLQGHVRAQRRAVVDPGIPRTEELLREFTDR